MQLEYFALICDGLYVEMHDTRLVGRPMHREIVPSCITSDIAYAVYLREELRLWDGLESKVIRVDPAVTVDLG